MIKRLLFLIFIFTTFGAHAQPQLLSSEMMPLGTIQQQKFIEDIYNIDTSIQGANVIWDFASLINSTTTSDRFVTIVDPGSTTIGISNPDANYFWLESPLESYKVFNKTNDKMELVAVDFFGYNDPQEVLVFPLQLGLTNIDTWYESTTNYGNYNLACIGYGTLITPAGTFTDVLMVRAMVSRTGYYVFPIYFWYSSEDGSTLLHFLTGDSLIPAKAIYRTSLTTSVEDADGLMELHYNNPVDHTLYVNFESNDAQARGYHLINAIGQRLASGMIEAGQHGLNVDMRNLASGVYVMQIETAQNKPLTFKVVKP